MINLSQQMTSLLYFVAFILCSVLEAVSHPFIVILFEERLICLTLRKPPFGVLSCERWSISSFFAVVDYN